MKTNTNRTSQDNLSGKALREKLRTFDNDTLKELAKWNKKAQAELKRRIFEGEDIR